MNVLAFLMQAAVSTTTSLPPNKAASPGWLLRRAGLKAHTWPHHRPLLDEEERHETWNDDDVAEDADPPDPVDLGRWTQTHDNGPRLPRLSFRPRPTPRPLCTSSAGRAVERPSRLERLFLQRSSTRQVQNSVSDASFAVRVLAFQKFGSSRGTANEKDRESFQRHADS